VQVLAHTARLLRAARELDQYGAAVGNPVLDCSRRLRARMGEVVNDVRAHSFLRGKIGARGVTEKTQWEQNWSALGSASGPRLPIP
jgi:hypothetical protein